MVLLVSLIRATKERRNKNIHDSPSTKSPTHARTKYFPQLLQIPPPPVCPLWCPLSHSVSSFFFVFFFSSLSLLFLLLLPSSPFLLPSLFIIFFFFLTTHRVAPERYFYGKKIISLNMQQTHTPFAFRIIHPSCIFYYFSFLIRVV